MTFAQKKKSERFEVARKPGDVGGKDPPRPQRHGIYIYYMTNSRKKSQKLNNLLLVTTCVWDVAYPDSAGVVSCLNGVLKKRNFFFYEDRIILYMPVPTPS